MPKLAFLDYQTGLLCRDARETTRRIPSDTAHADGSAPDESNDQAGTERGWEPARGQPRGDSLPGPVALSHVGSVRNY
jgi:hypothetical protein